MRDLPLARKMEKNPPENRLFVFRSNEIDFRFVESEMGIQPDGLARYGRPQDFNDLAEGNDPAKLIDFLKLQGQIQADQEDSSDDEGS